jgi:hypothetical protein
MNNGSVFTVGVSHDTLYPIAYFHTAKMKLNVSLLISSLSVIYITGIEGSFKYRLPLAKDEGLRLKSPHHVEKRQTEPDICDVVTVENICTSGYYEDYAYLSYQCFRIRLARSIQSSCRSNSAGKFCGNFEYDPEDFVTACGMSPSTCTPEC